MGSACGIDIFNLGITVLKELTVLHVFIETGFCICSGYPNMSSSFFLSFFFLEISVSSH